MFLGMFRLQSNYYAYTPYGDKRMNNETQIIYDPRFREKLRVARMDERYRIILETLPVVYIGSRSRLHYIVEIMSAEMKRVFETHRMSVPPWRTREALLSRWA